MSKRPTSVMVSADHTHLKAMCPMVSLETLGIVRIDYTQCETISLEAMLRSYSRQVALCPQRKSPVLVVGGRVASVEYKAQRFASSPEVCSVTAAAAIVAQSFLERHLARMFLVYHRPPYPVQLFSNENEARSWLNGFIPAQV